MRRQVKLALGIALALAGSTSGRLFAQSVPSSQQATSSVDISPAPPETVPGLDWAFGVGIEHTDNIDRSATNATSQNVLQPTFDFSLNHQGSTLQTTATGLLQYNDYLEGYFGNELFGQLAGALNWTISPKRLDFVVQDNASVQPVSTRRGNTPANLQQVNVLVAGPTLSFRLGSSEALHGQADLRYIDTTASKTKDFDSQRGMGALRIIRDLSATSQLSGNIEALSVDSSNVDPLVEASRYDEYNLYGRFTSRLQHLSVDISVGGTRLDFAHGRGSDSGSLVRMAAAWQIGTHHGIQLSVADDLTDSTNSLVTQPTFSNIEIANPSVQVGRAVISPAIFRERAFNLGYAFSGPLLNLSVGPYYQRLRQINGNDLSRESYGVLIDANYQIRPLLTLGVSAGYQVIHYDIDHSESRDPAYGISLSRQFTPHWSWSLAFRHEQRLDSLAGLGYHENALYAFLYYRR